MHCCFFFGDGAQFHQFHHIRMVSSQRIQNLFLHQIRAAVTNMGYIGFSVIHYSCNHSRSHFCKFQRGIGLIKYGFVGCLKSACEQIRNFLYFFMFRHIIHKGFNGAIACYFAGIASPHTVCDDIQMLQRCIFFRQIISIFVIFAASSDVADSDCLHVFPPPKAFSPSKAV